MFADTLSPYGASSSFLSQIMRLARSMVIKNCLELSLFIWKTCLATETTVGMAITIVLIVPGAR